MRKLKWSFQRDRMAKMVRDGTVCTIPNMGSLEALSAFAQWLENRGKGIVQESERVRLALCPGIGKRVQFYEDLHD